MVRAPCCAKVGLKRGPWTQDEDNILTAYIHQNGHPNWRALPKLAGLLRCGKSCRLRWANYLRPDIKRGNFSKQEEDTIIQLHQLLGNRWSVIAGKLPGRTDNEIKNVWHTHLKKRLQNCQNVCIPKGQSDEQANSHDETLSDRSEESRAVFVSQPEVNGLPQQSSSEVSSVTQVRDSSTVVEDEQLDISSFPFPEIDESFWTEALSTDVSSMQSDEHVDISSEAFLGIDESFWTDALSTNGSSMQSDFPLMSPLSTTVGVESVDSWMNDGMDFWYDLFMKAEELPDIFL